MVIKVAAKSDIGCHRKKNEDSFYVDSEQGLYIICDGMGGHLAGEVASSKAIEYVVAFFSNAREKRILPSLDQVDFHEVWEQLVVEAVESCCDNMLEYADTHPEFCGMATTITVLLTVQGVAFVGYLGDSRLYLKHADTVKQLTSDHTLFEEFNSANPSWINLNGGPDSVQHFKQILTRCVGRKRNFEVDSFSFPLANDDVLLLCTDGLSNYFLDEETVVKFLSKQDSLSTVESLIDFANQNGGQDNITAIVIQIASLDDAKSDDSALCPHSITYNLNDTQDWPRS